MVLKFRLRKYCKGDINECILYKCIDVLYNTEANIRSQSKYEKYKVK